MCEGDVAVNLPTAHARIEINVLRRQSVLELVEAEEDLVVLPVVSIGRQIKAWEAIRDPRVHALLGGWCAGEGTLEYEQSGLTSRATPWRAGVANQTFGESRELACNWRDGMKSSTREYPSSRWTASRQAA